MEEQQKITHLETLIKSLNTELADSLYQTINVLSSIIQLTERFYDGSHSRFVSEKSAELAKIIGLSKEDIFQIKVAGLLHDIGKVHFFDSALYKYPNEMRPAEFEHYALHSEMGYHILKNHKGLENIAEIVLNHHERLDGSGFPKGLRAHQIHPGAAIISVVNYYHNAVYKIRREKALNAEQNKITNTTNYLNSTKDRYNSAMNFLHSKKGIYFDRKVVDNFIMVIETDRTDITGKMVSRVSVNQIKPGMIFVESYHTSYGLLIAAKGETVSQEMIKGLVRFAENGELPHKLLLLVDLDVT